MKEIVLDGVTYLLTPKEEEPVKPVEKVLWMEDIRKANKSTWMVNWRGALFRTLPKEFDDSIDTVPTEADAENLITHIKLINCMRYFNGDWVADWDNGNEIKHCLLCKNGKEIFPDNNYNFNRSPIYFKDEESARETIRIIGEEALLKYFNNN